MKCTETCFKIVSIILLLLSASIAQDKKLNVAVLDLDPTGIAKPEAQFLSDRLRTELFETGKFRVVERDKMNAILTEQGFQQTGCTSVECAVEIGQLLNVKMMVAGNIGKIEDLYSISLRLINVETGALLHTATRDFEGRLSEVLTEVIPDVAADLSLIEIDEPMEEKEERSPVRKSDMDTSNRFAIILKGGLASLRYTADINAKIQELDPAQLKIFKDLPNHSIFGFEGQYTLSPRWLLKLGIASENLLSKWTVAIDDPLSSLVYTNISFERDYQFINTYLGFNFFFWQKPEIYDFFIGVDIGTTTFESRLRQQYVQINGDVTDRDDTYQYSAFTWKLSLGGIYYLSSSFSLAMDLAAKVVEAYDTTDQRPNDIPDLLYKGIILPEEVSASGLQLNFYLGYHF
jgi:TolB-like protein